MDARPSTGAQLTAPPGAGAIQAPPIVYDNSYDKPHHRPSGPCCSNG
jgi:hypothetical protein